MSGVLWQLIQFHSSVLGQTNSANSKNLGLLSKIQHIHTHTYTHAPCISDWVEGQTATRPNFYIDWLSTLLGNIAYETVAEVTRGLLLV